MTKKRVAILVAGAAALLAVVAVAVALLAGSGDDSKSRRSATARVGPGGGALAFDGVRIVVAPNTLRAVTEVRISRSPAPILLAPGARPLQRRHLLRIAAPARKPVRVAFDLPAGTAAGAPVVAVRGEDPDALPAFLTGTRTARRLTVTTPSLSNWVPTDVSPLFGTEPDAVQKMLAGLYRDAGKFIGYRGSKPTCPTDSPTIASSVEDAERDPVVFATACQAQGEQTLKIVNDRAFMWEFPIPAGARVVSTAGRGFSETVFDDINRLYKSGWAIVPGGGSVVLSGVKPGTKIGLRRNGYTLASDVGLFIALRGGKFAGAEQVSDVGGFVGCTFGLESDALDPRVDLSDPISVVRQVLSDCGALLGDAIPPRARRPKSLSQWARRGASYLKQTATRAARQAAARISAVLGAATVLAGLVDYFTEDRKEVGITLNRRPKPAPKPTLSGPLTVNGFGAARLGMTIAELNAATGTTWRTEPPAGGFQTPCWRPAGKRGVTAVVSGGRVEDFYIDNQGPFATASGIRPGDQMDKASAAYGSRLARLPYANDQVGQGADYLFVPTDAADRRFRMVFWEMNGTIGLIANGPVGLENTEEFCA